eukprot:6200896-Pleurochrysis_carterae.AAC.1
MTLKPLLEFLLPKAATPAATRLSLVAFQPFSLVPTLLTRSLRLPRHRLSLLAPSRPLLPTSCFRSPARVRALSRALSTTASRPRRRSVRLKRARLPTAPLTLRKPPCPHAPSLLQASTRTGALVAAAAVRDHTGASLSTRAPVVSTRRFCRRSSCPASQRRRPPGSSSACTLPLRRR